VNALTAKVGLAARITLSQHLCENPVVCGALKYFGNAQDNSQSKRVVVRGGSGALLVTISWEHAVRGTDKFGIRWDIVGSKTWTVNNKK